MGHMYMHCEQCFELFRYDISIINISITNLDGTPFSVVRY